MHRLHAGFALVLLLSLSPSLSQAQLPEDAQTESIRRYLLQAFQRNMELDLTYLAAAPDSMLRWAPTVGVRDFSQQLTHTTHDFFRPWRDDAPPASDSTKYLNDRESLAANLTEGYGWIIQRIETMSTEELRARQTSAPVMGEPM
jgi:hypothetical protein